MGFLLFIVQFSIIHPSCEFKSTKLVYAYVKLYTAAKLNFSADYV